MLSKEANVFLSSGNEIFGCSLGFAIQEIVISVPKIQEPVRYTLEVDGSDSTYIIKKLITQNGYITYELEEMEGEDGGFVYSVARKDLDIFTDSMTSDILSILYLLIRAIEES